MLEESWWDITTFVILYKQYRYKRIPLYIKSGPKIFQRRIEEIIKNLECVLIYIYDIIVCRKTKEEHNKRLVAVLEIFYEHNVCINFEKVNFIKTKILSEDM